MKKLLFFVLIIVVISSFSYAKQLTVCPEQGDGCDYTSIQAAIDASENGDEIIVRKSVYNEHDIKIEDKCLTINGEGAETTIINAAGLGRGIYVSLNYPPDTCNINLSNLQIRGGVSDQGGGIYLYNHSNVKVNVVMDNLYIVGNSASQKGGGIYLYSYRDNALNVLITHSNIERNSATQEGGGVYLGGGTIGTIKESKIYGNTSGIGGGGIVSGGKLTVVSSVIRANKSGDGGGLLLSGEATLIKDWIIDNISSEEGGGIDLHDQNNANLNIYSSIFAFNKAGTKGGAMCLGPRHLYSSHSVLIRNITVYGNDATAGNGFFLATKSSSSPLTLQIYNSVFSNGEDDIFFEKDDSGNAYGDFILNYNVFSKEVDYPTGSITKEGNTVIENIGFVDPEAYDFSLLESSPLINIGDDSSAYLEDIAGSLRATDVDVGACEYPSTCSLEKLEPGTPQFAIYPNADFVEKTAKVSFVEDWNLAGLASLKAKTISAIFKDNLASVFTLWKWDSVYKRWKLYTADEEIKNYLQTFPTSIELLNENATLNPGEGFWVKATEPFTLEFKGYVKSGE